MSDPLTTETETVPPQGSLPAAGWIKTSDRLPLMEQLVAYILSGAPFAPKIGFRDCPRAYCDRHPESDHFGWSLTTWWTESGDDGEAWENEVVTYWHPLAELPS